MSCNDNLIVNARSARRGWCAPGNWPVSFTTPVNLLSQQWLFHTRAVCGSVGSLSSCLHEEYDCSVASLRGGVATLCCRPPRHEESDCCVARGLPTLCNRLPTAWVAEEVALAVAAWSACCLGRRSLRQGGGPMRSVAASAILVRSVPASAIFERWRGHTLNGAPK